MAYKDNLRMLPSHMHYAIKAWIERGEHPGGFLTALLSNDLMDAFGRADEDNTAAMRNWVVYLYNYAPSGCFGSPEKFKAWEARGGLLGHEVASAAGAA